MIVRVQSKSGTKRITANSSDLLRTLLEKVSQLVMNTETRSSCTTECCQGAATEGSDTGLVRVRDFQIQWISFGFLDFIWISGFRLDF